ncbi:MAG: hypothetical protein WA213_18605, partial [Terriglobales bacterium]
MTLEHDSHNGGSAVLDAPETVQPSPVETQASAPDAAQDTAEHSAPTPAAETHEAPATTSSVTSPSAASSSSTPPEAPAASASDDFAAALENFTTETEESVGDDHVIKGTVVKLTGTHVVVDFGSKSEGMVALSEVLD